MLLTNPDYLEIVKQEIISNSTLTRREVLILDLFFSTHPKHLAKNYILKNIWGKDFNTNTNVVEVALSRMRKKIKNSEHVEIKNMFGGYYKLLINEPAVRDQQTNYPPSLQGQ